MAKFVFEKDLFGHKAAPVNHDFPVASAQTFEVGDLVYLSSGQVTKCADGQTSVLGLMAQRVGTALTANVLVTVALAAPGFVYRATADADASSALTNKTYDINTTTQTVDIADSSGGCIKILEVVDSNTDVRILFTEFDLGCIN